MVDGDIIVVYVVANTDKEALNKVKYKKPFRGLTGDMRPDFIIEDLGEHREVEWEDFVLSQNGDKCTLIHKASGASIVFEAGRFKATCVVFPKQKASVGDIIIKEAWKWLLTFNYGLAFDLRKITRAFMQEQGVTGRALSLEIGCYPQSLSGYINGERSLTYGQMQVLLGVLQFAGAI